MTSFNPDLFDLAVAEISVKSEPSSGSFELFILECNDLFTELTTVKAHKDIDVAEFAFGRRRNKYLAELYKFQTEKIRGEMVLRYKPMRKYLLTKILPLETGTLQLVCFNFTSFQRRLNSYSLQEIGYVQYIENLHGLAFQRLLKPDRKEVFTAGAYEEITGYTREQAKDFKSWLEIIHPEDKTRIEEAAFLLYNEPSHKSEQEYRIIRKDGKIRWIHSYDCNFTSEDGNMQMAQGLMVDVTKQKLMELKLIEANAKILEQNERLEEMSMTDHMTGLSNRRAMQQVLEYLIDNYKRTGEVFSILMIDLDNFKQVNDKYGHDAGDAVICEVSRLLKKNLRKIDYKSRWGGEEFLVSLPRVDGEEALKIGKKLLQAVRETVIEHHKIDIHVTFSMGVTTYNRKISFQTLLKEADRALYKAKETGRNKIIQWN
ncbi:MAG: sensor domain-containing diguanylate cyclase [Spirochaetaceae bacterium]|nr:sensor domain-containing diguanylate cyclase [Spirochaetaceae bacterium]